MKKDIDNIIDEATFIDYEADFKKRWVNLNGTFVKPTAVEAIQSDTELDENFNESEPIGSEIVLTNGKSVYTSVLPEDVVNTLARDYGAVLKESTTHDTRITEAVRRVEKMVREDAYRDGLKDATGGGKGVDIESGVQKYMEDWANKVAEQADK